MNAAHLIVVLAMAILCIYAYFKTSLALNPEKFIKGMLGLFALMLISLSSLFLVTIVMKKNEVLEKQNKEKCPEYKKIENVYILKQ